MATTEPAAAAADGGSGAAAVADTYTGTTFAIQEEDHTLANTLRFFLNKKCVWCQGNQGCNVQPPATMSAIDQHIPSPAAVESNTHYTRTHNNTQPQCGILWLQHASSN